MSLFWMDLLFSGMTGVWGCFEVFCLAHYFFGGFSECKKGQWDRRVLAWDGSTCYALLSLSLGPLEESTEDLWLLCPYWVYDMKMESYFMIFYDYALYVTCGAECLGVGGCTPDDSSLEADQDVWEGLGCFWGLTSRCYSNQSLDP